MTLVSLRSSYIVFVLYSTLVFLSTSMFTKFLVYPTHLQPRLLFECLDGMSPVRLVASCTPSLVVATIT
ncbi:hypothetical protein BDR03DRAFT_967718 [Suillus americanus]|nr:hypothetical protein BDR03DRAFT_967718 [Suillus americanus]